MQGRSAGHEASVRNPQLRRHVRQNGVWKIYREQAVSLACSKQRRERQTFGIGSAVRGDEGTIRLGQPELRLEFHRRQSIAKAWVGGAINGRHEVSKKGSADTPLGTLKYQRDTMADRSSIKEYLYGRTWPW